MGGIYCCFSLYTLVKDKSKEAGCSIAVRLICFELTQFKVIELCLREITFWSHIFLHQQNFNVLPLSYVLLDVAQKEQIKLLNSDVLSKKRLNEDDELNGETTSCTVLAWHSSLVWCDAHFTGSQLILRWQAYVCGLMVLPIILWLTLNFNCHLLIFHLISVFILEEA